MVELLVVIAIVATLSSIAYPTYVAHTKKSIRAQAAAMLTKVAQSQQNHLMIRRQYATTIDVLSSPDQRVVDKVSEHYVYPPTLFVENGYSSGGYNHPPRFTAYLVPIVGGMMEGDGYMCVDATGSVLRNCESSPITWYED